MTKAPAHGGIRIGCAGWNLPKASVDQFPSAGTHLQRYAARFNCVEINSSFYKPHKPATYARWADSTPVDFRFSVKLPKEITHVRKLVDVESPLTALLHEILHLGDKLGPVLIQQPPSATFEASIVEAFLSLLRDKFTGPVVWEPRHETWFTAEAAQLLTQYQVARVAADPELASGAGQPGGYDRLVYFRLHGAPRVYYSEYSSERINGYAQQLRQHAARGAEVWCIFDNTALGAATINAFELMNALDAQAKGR